jgi:uncharacterized membrane protein HdeD (DUF308 family)
MLEFFGEDMIENIMWIVTGIAVIGFFLNMQMNKWGYLFWGLSNIGFAIYDFYKIAYAQAGLFVFYSVMCIVGFIKWSKKNELKK